jgi:hypothetical protein
MMDMVAPVCVGWSTSTIRDGEGFRDTDCDVIDTDCDVIDAGENGGPLVTARALEETLHDV